MKISKVHSYSEPDVGMRFTAKISNEWTQTTERVTQGLQGD